MRTLPPTIRYWIDILTVEFYYRETSFEWPFYLSMAVKWRLDALHRICRHIEKHGDIYGDKMNVKAIMAAYLRGELQWDVEKVTYWFKGEMLGKPNYYNAVHLRHLMKEHGKPKKFGFWVEGVSRICY